MQADEFGFTWMVVDRVDDDVDGLCTDLHALNTTLAEQGFGDGLLCTVVPFADSRASKVGLVYLYKQGTFYGFAPTGPQDPRQPARAPGPRHPRRRAAHGARPPALAGPLGRPRALTRRVGANRRENTPSRRKEA